MNDNVKLRLRSALLYLEHAKQINEETAIDPQNLTPEMMEALMATGAIEIMIASLEDMVGPAIEVEDWFVTTPDATGLVRVDAANDTIILCPPIWRKKWIGKKFKDFKKNFHPENGLPGWYSFIRMDLV